MYNCSYYQGCCPDSFWNNRTQLCERTLAFLFHYQQEPHKCVFWSKFGDINHNQILGDTYRITVTIGYPVKFS